MSFFVTVARALALVSLVSGCSLPRGAAISSEVLSGQNDADRDFSVIAVSRSNVDRIRAWPATGWAGGYHWIPNKRGPASGVIRTGDRIDLTIWDSQENSLLVPVGTKAVTMNGLTVSSQGTIFVPYLNSVVVNGLTAEQARERIQGDLSPIVASAQVQVAVHPGTQNAVDLVSGVARPGRYPLEDRNSTILALIAEGGGIAATLRNPLVRLIRAGKTYEIRSERLFSDASANTVLRGGDKILVEDDKRYFTALGAAGSEQLVYFEKEQISALEAMSLIGGLEDQRASLQGVLVLREYAPNAVRQDGSGPDMTDVVFSFDLSSADGLFAARNFQINPRDTVLVTESPVTSMRTVLGLVGASLGIANATR